ncbi:MAG: hypothetical protein ACTSPV_18590 [Candidatus Hodarchaeales archaeon]
MDSVLNSNKQKQKIRETDYLETMEEEFKWEFLHHPDLKAAYALGLLFNRVARQQEDILKTRGLHKKMRYLFDRMSGENLLKIFAECNKISFGVQAKTRSASFGYDNIRSRAEELMGQFKGESKEEELSLAFMMGYDCVRRTWDRLNRN